MLLLFVRSTDNRKSTLESRPRPPAKQGRKNNAGQFATCSLQMQSGQSGFVIGRIQGKTTMKDFLLIVAFILGCGFGFMFSATIYRQDKIKSAQTQKNNTVEIIQTTQQIKDKIQNANEKCIDIFNIDISECVQ